MAATSVQHVPDILDCLAQLSNDEVPTPPELARSMLGLLPEDVWSEPDYRWLDPCCKSGVFLREVASRLLSGLAEWEPDYDARREHIYRNMLWGTSVTRMTGIIARRTLYCSRDAAGTHSIVRFATESGNLPFVPALHTFSAGHCTVCGAPEELERGEDRENYAFAFVHDAYPTKEISEMRFDAD
jgi:site-specific DNA-methyltransferase (adenine-specific)